MSELMITAVWVVTLCVVVYCAVAEITRLFSDDVQGRRKGPGGGSMYFDVARVEREAMLSGRGRRRGARR